MILFRSPLSRGVRSVLAPLFALLLAVVAFAAEPRIIFGAKDLPPGAKLPQPVRREAPVYPYAMRDSRLNGRVFVEFIIDTAGNVVNPVILRSNNPWFERPAIDAILRWKFKPGEINGRKVNVRANQQLDFEVDNGSAESGLWTVNRKKTKDGAELPPEFQWDRPPVTIGSAYPVYPLAALQAGQTGLVTVGFIIDPDGRVVSPQLQEAVTPEFGQAVLAAVDAWSFAPATKKDGTRCFAGVSMKFNFLTAPGRGDVPYNDEMRAIVRQLKEHPEKIVPAAQLDLPPKPISRRPPVYPTARLAQGEAGQAKIEFFIDRNGDVQLPRILECSAPEFGYAAVQAIATWRYEVPRLNGRPVTARAVIPLEFAMRASPAKKP